ncbi:MAG: hydrolase [Microbacteriaceae bacterium]|nr:hydrolase [Microbacteriaceae bacterium]
MTTGEARDGEKSRTRRGITWYGSRAEVDGLALVAKRFAGPADAASGPFVLVHGIGVSSRYFHPMAQQLAKLGETWAVDLPGYGAAPNPKRQVSIAEHAGVLAGFLRQAGIEKPTVVGHSMGSQVVSRFAVDFPHLSDRIVLMAPTVDPRHRTFGAQALRLGVDVTREWPIVNGIVFTDYMFRCGIPWFIRQLSPLLDDVIEERLPRLSQPTLVLRGDRDPIVSREWAEAVTALLPHGEFAEVKGPHIVMYTDPVRTAELIAGHAARE